MCGNTHPLAGIACHKMQNVGFTGACLRNCLNSQYQWINIEYIDYKYCQEYFYANLSHHFLLPHKRSGNRPQKVGGKGKYFMND